MEFISAGMTSLISGFFQFCRVWKPEQPNVLSKIPVYSSLHNIIQYQQNKRRCQMYYHLTLHILRNVHMACALLYFVTQGQFWPSGIVITCVSVCVCACVCVCQSVCQSLVCPHHNSGPVQARIEVLKVVMVDDLSISMVFRKNVNLPAILLLMPTIGVDTCRKRSGNL